MINNKFDHITDNDLLEKFYETSNNEYLGLLLQRYTLLLLGVCMKYLKNETDAKDAVQQVFLKVINELPKYRVTYIKSWIYMVAKNHCLMQLRKKNIITDVDNISIENEDEFDIEIYRQKEAELQLLEQSIESLNDEQKKCVLLFYIQKKSYTEIKSSTGFTLMQVKSYIQNGKRNLKLLIEKKRNQSNELI